MQEAVEESVFHVKKGGLIVSRGFFFHFQRLGDIPGRRRKKTQRGQF